MNLTIENSISDALIDGWRDAREGRYRNTYLVGSDCYRAYEQSYCDEAAKDVIKLRIAGGEQIHAIEDSLDLRENRQRVGLIERFISWAKNLVGCSDV